MVITFFSTYVHYDDALIRTRGYSKQHAMERAKMLNCEQECSVAQLILFAREVVVERGLRGKNGSEKLQLGTIGYRYFFVSYIGLL